MQQFDVVYFFVFWERKKIAPLYTLRQRHQTKVCFWSFPCIGYLKSVNCFNLFVQSSSCSKTQFFWLDIPRRPIVLLPILTIDPCSPVVTMTRMGAEGPQRWPTPCRMAELIRWVFNFTILVNGKLIHLRKNNFDVWIN